MSGVNKVIIVGRLGQDPELKTVGDNQVARLSIATSENWKDKSGNKQERVEWHKVVVWNQLADLAGKYLKKGRQVYVEGKLQTRSWEDNGQKKYMTEVVCNVLQFLGDNPNSQNQRQNSGPDDFGPNNAYNTDDEIPF